MPRGANTPSEIFRSVMEKAKQRLLLESAEAADFRHKGIRGDERAASLADFFRERLPRNLGVAKGEAIDYQDTRTGQLDFVIYDQARCAAIRAGKENLLLPCEALYCALLCGRGKSPCPRALQAAVHCSAPGWFKREGRSRPLSVRDLWI